jgi:hypothetical protein
MSQTHLPRGISAVQCRFCLWILVLLPSLNASAQLVMAPRKEDALDVIMSMEFGNSLGRAVDAAGQMRASGADFSQSVAEARRNFQTACRSGTGINAAKDELDAILWQKDLWYLFLAVADTGDGRMAALDLISGGVDGGIRPNASIQFRNWTTALRDEIHLVPKEQPYVDRLSKAVDATQIQKALYIRARNWAEIDEAERAGAVFPWSQDRKAYALMLLQRHGKVRPAKDVLAHYDGLCQLFGEDAVLKAAESVRHAPRNAQGLAVDGENPDGLRPDYLLEARLAETGPEGYFRRIVSLGLHRDMEKALPAIQRYLWCYGRDAVIKAADRIKKAPRRSSGTGDIENPAAIDARRTDSYGAFQDVLASTSVEGYLRAMIAFGQQITEEAALKTAYEKFLADHGGKDAVLNAATQARDFWMSYDGIATPERMKLVRLRYAARNNDPSEDYKLLMEVLAKGTQVLGPEVKLVDDPSFAYWSKFKAGTTVIYSTTTKEIDGQTKRDTVSAVTEMRVRVVTSDAKQIEIEKADRFVRGGRSGDFKGSSFPLFPRGQKSTTSSWLKVDPQELVGVTLPPSPQNPAAAPEQSGQETLTVAGESYNCRWYKWRTQRSDQRQGMEFVYETTWWLCDDVPGKTVRILDRGLSRPLMIKNAGFSGTEQDQMLRSIKLP